MYFLKNIKKNTFYILFLLYTINLSGGESGELYKIIYTIPTPIVTMSQIITYCFILLFVTIGLIDFFSSSNREIDKAAFFLGLAYFILLWHSLVFGDDQLRYLVLSLIPVFYVYGLIGYLKNIDINDCYDRLQSALWLFLVISIFFSIVNFKTGSRISGYFANPNAFSMAVFGSIIIFSLIDKSKNFRYNLFVSLGSILIYLSGSRVGMLSLIVFGLFYIKHNIINPRTIILFILIFCGIFFFNDSGDSFERYLNFQNSASESGRSDVWDKVYNYIYLNELVGTGPNVRDNIGTGNIHNSFLRVYVMTGIPYSILFFLFFLIGLIYIWINSYKWEIHVYLLSIPIFFFAEDYIVSIISPFSFYLVFVLFYKIREQSYKFKSIAYQKR